MVRPGRERTVSGSRSSRISLTDPVPHASADEVFGKDRGIRPRKQKVSSAEGRKGGAHQSRCLHVSTAVARSRPVRRSTLGRTTFRPAWTSASRAGHLAAHVAARWLSLPARPPKSPVLQQNTPTAPFRQNKGRQ